MFVAVCAFALAIALWLRDPNPNTKEFELMKTCLQVLGVVLLGGIVTVAIHERDMQVEDDRRDRDHKLDERLRLDDRVRACLDSTVDVYNDVKRIRRLTEAKMATDGIASISLKTYDSCGLALNDLQLTIESMVRRSPVLDEQLLPGAHLVPTSDVQDGNLRSQFRKLEKYLNNIVDEYQSLRHQVAASNDGLALDNLPRLRAFITDTKDFQHGASRPVDAIVGRLERALLAPTGFWDRE